MPFFLIENPGEPMTPLDYFSWGYIKAVIYVDPPPTSLVT